MDLSKTNSKHVYFENKDYLNKVLSQVQRDFNMSGIDFEDPINIPQDYDALFTVVFEPIANLVRSSDIQLKNLLYRIDIPETSIQKRLSSEVNNDLENVITTLVIERCLLKVLTREKYS